MYKKEKKRKSIYERGKERRKERETKNDGVRTKLFRERNGVDVPNKTRKKLRARSIGKNRGARNFLLSMPNPVNF